MQLVRRRYFGHDDFLDPLDRLKPQKSLLKPEDISYLSILEGVKNLIANQEQIIAAIDRNFEKVKNDPNLENAQKESHFSTLTKMAEILPQRIGWMKENFSADLELIEDQTDRKRFDAVKWRLHPKFAELMKFEAEISRETPRLVSIRETPAPGDKQDGITARAKVPSWDEIMFGQKPQEEPENNS
jgi:hypothetical protein